VSAKTRAVWALYAVVLAATVVTYARLPPGATWRFELTGAAGAFSRAVTYLDFPVALAALALLWPAWRDPLARVAALLCATALVPGVVRTDTMEASWRNAPAALGVLIAVPVTLRRDDFRAPLGRGRAIAIAALAVWSTPWLLAACGVHASSIPILRAVFRSSEPTPGAPELASVHLGLHEGLFGAQLAATALLLSVRRASRGHSFYLALLLVYGVMVAAEDGWSEQIVKRGLTSWTLPSVLEPRLTPGWAGLLIAALGVHLWWSRTRPVQPVAD
jgi:hypothetical protein